MFRICALLLGFFAVFAAPAAAGTVDYDRLDQRLQQLASGDDMVGLAVAVIENGEITFARGYGVTAQGEGPVMPGTVFRWASVSKGVATSLVTKLAAEGRFALTDTPASFGTTLRLPGGGERAVTLEDLMAHRVGIVANAYDTLLEDDADPADIRRRLGSLKTICPLRECHSYQNVAFDTLAEVIEASIGLPYDAAAEIILFRPLRMTTASTGSGALMGSASWARPHVKRRDDAAPVLQTVKEPYYRVPAAGGVNGSILDLAQWARAQMGLAPDVLSPAMLEELHTPRVFTPREQNRLNRQFEGQMQEARYALGWRTYQYGPAGHQVVGHRGAVEGYRSLVLMDPELDSGVVALWNSNARRPVGVELEVMDMIYDLPPRDWLQLEAGDVGAAK